MLINMYSPMLHAALIPIYGSRHSVHQKEDFFLNFFGQFNYKTKSYHAHLK